MNFSIPPELKLRIAELLDPISSLNFAFTCKLHWHLCDSLLKKHKRLLAENQTLDTIGAGRILWTTLRNVLLDPSLGWYIRELSLPMDRQTNWDLEDWQIQPGDELVPFPEEDRDLLVAAARELKDLYPFKFGDLVPSRHWREEEEGDMEDAQDVVTYIEKSICAGRDDGIISVLVHHLPMLKVLRFTDTELEGGVFTRLLEQVAIGYTMERASRLPFQRLETVAVAHGDSEGNCAPEWALYFNCIPSVRYFAASCMGGSMADCYYHGDNLPSSSNVKELYFHYSRCHAKALSEILRGITALERFTYLGGGALVAEDVIETPRRYIKALSKHQGHSLQELLLVCDYPGGMGNEAEDLKRVSLRDFHTLKKLRCDWETLWPNETTEDPVYEYSSDEDEDDDKDEEDEEEEEEEAQHANFQLKDILPMSLESLHFCQGVPSDKREMVMKQLNDAREALPNLKSVRITDSVDRSEWFANPLLEALDGQGYV